MIPPAWLRFEVNTFKFWFPLFLLWPLGILIALVVLPIVFIAVLLERGADKAIVAPFYFYNLICAFKGMYINVDSKKDHFKMVIL